MYTTDINEITHKQAHKQGSVKGLRFLALFEDCLSENCRILAASWANWVELKRVTDVVIRAKSSFAEFLGFSGQSCQCRAEVMNVCGRAPARWAFVVICVKVYERSTK